MNYLLIVASMLICSFTCTVYADTCPVMITYEGKGAGAVVFDGKLHSAKGLTCKKCHEGQGLMPALFEMKKWSTAVNMRKIELGRTCGSCHVVTENDDRNCSSCHHK